jgi:hypothetical protein
MHQCNIPLSALAGRIGTIGGMPNDVLVFRKGSLEHCHGASPRAVECLILVPATALQ